MDSGRLFSRFVLWTLVCGVSAAPSYIWAAPTYDRVGMICGVAVYIGLYTAASMTSTAKQIETEPLVRRAVRIGYITRIIISVVYPIGMAVDLIPGLMSISVVKNALGHEFGFEFALYTTLVQGTFVNLILGVYMLMVYGILQSIRPAPAAAPESRTNGG